MEIYAGCLTDKGAYRKKNQDSAVCHVKRGGGDILAAACVCDGIGSFPKSEIAAQMVTRGITRWFEGIQDLFPEVLDGETAAEDLEITVRELNELIFQYRRENGIDIGCTMSLLLLTGGSYVIFHAGDSRIYRAGDTLCQLTRDEVSMAEASGRVRPLLENYMGKAKELWVNRIEGRIEGDEVFLLGTDGLFKRLEQEDVAGLGEKIKSDKEAGEACRRLLRLVMERGERDNISCVLLRCTSK